MLLKQPTISGGARIRSREPHRCCAALVASEPVSKALSLDALPAELLNAVVKLDAPRANGETSHVYVMGVSHCSKKQAEQVKSLIHAVKPEVVMVELCKDRVGLLADGKVEAQAKNLWHVRKVQIEGLPTSDEWPTESSLKKLLVTRAGRPVSTQDIEVDISRLLSTGLFKSARPAAENPPPDEAPEFSISFGDDGKAKLLVIPPLGRVKFIVEPRSLPSISELSVRVDSSLMDAKVDAEKLKQAAELVVSEVKSGASSPLVALLKAKQRFAEAIPDASIASTFSGCETGSIEVILKRVKPSDLPFESGFEATAVGGEGWGIDPFRPQRPLTKLSNKMYLSTATLEAMRKDSRGGLASPTPLASNEGAVSKERLLEPRSLIRAWTDEEIKEAKRSDPPLDPLADTIKDVLVFLYAKFQYEAGRKTGIERGAAWQAALEAATEVGAQQFVLSDRPTVISEHRFAEGLVGSASLRMGSALGLFVSTVIADLVVDANIGLELGAVAGSLLVGAAIMWPIIGPFFEIKRLAGMSAEEIEDTVRQKKPLQQAIASSKEGENPGKIFGEDALLDWPGADTTLLSERDEYMARATAGVATASGPSPPSLCPAFILDRVDGRLVWRLMQGKGAPDETSTRGYGDGEYLPLTDVKCVVNIVGTAHVQGIVRAWQKALASPSDVDSLIKLK